MATYVYNKLKKQAKDINQTHEASQKWLLDAAKKIRSVSGNKLMNDRPRLLPTRKLYRKHVGRLMMFYYDPKTKDKLPYFDTFPCVFPVQIYLDGFLGINLHYLPRKLRMQLLKSLISVYDDDYLNEKKKLEMSYKILNSSRKHWMFRPCIKRYLTNHLRSKYYLVDPNEWEMVVMLPTERFVGASKNKVWKDSMDSLGLGTR